MDSYKKILKNKYTRFFILYLLRFIPDKLMLRIQYWIKFKRKLDLKNPKRFTEKIQAYKLFYKNEKMVRCSDKYLVREYIKEKGLEGILNELYCVFDSPEQIDLSVLPDKFVLKVSNGSGTNLICRDKSKLDLNKVKNDFKKYYTKIKANTGREWPYMKSKSVIVAEKLLEDSSKENIPPTDYKIFCYNGKPEYVICISDRYTDKVNHLVYDTNWNKQHVISEGAYLDADEPRPENLDEMLRVASILSEEFPFARIDLYSVENKIIFGEITFYPWSGYMEFEPEEFDFVLGEKFNL